MADYGPWRYYIYKKKGRLYLKRQRGRWVPGWEEPDKQYEHLGPADGGLRLPKEDFPDLDFEGTELGKMLREYGALTKRKRKLGVGLMVFGDRDEYDRPYRSLYNYLKDKTAEMRRKADELSSP
jgi:hypothetical protein